MVNLPGAPDSETIIKRGEDAQALLNTPYFIEVVNDLSNYHATALMATQPGLGHLEARNFHHLMHYALTEILDDLRTRAEAGEERRRLVRNAEMGAYE